jgi:putative PIN family toxin of toxin-antitoxin system
VIRAVFDCGIIISGIGWAGNPRRCLDLVYGGQVLLCVSEEVVREYTTKVPSVLAAERRRVDAEQELARLFKLAHFFEPAELGKQRSRDLGDDRYLAAALGAEAEAVVSNDRDLLALKKPFGIPILTPIEFIKMVRSPGSL